MKQQEYLDECSKRTRNGFNQFLTKTRLRVPLLELRILEFTMIESMAASWLKSVGIDYCALEECNSWVILIGALIAMDKAEFYGEIKTKRPNEGVVEAFEGFLKQGIPVRDFWMIRADIENSFTDEKIQCLSQALQDRCGFSKFEASAWCIANFVSAWATKNDGILDKVSDALYQFYVRAADDYFTGYDNDQ